MSYQPKRMSNDDNPYRSNNYNRGESTRSYYNETRQSNYGKTQNSKPQNSKPQNYKSKGNKKINKVMLAFKILALVFFITTIVFYVSINKLNLLPTSYFVAFTLAEIIITTLISIGLAKKHKTYKLNVLCLIIMLLLTGIYLYVINFANAANDFLGSVFQEVKETEEYYVVVKEDSEYENIDDLDGESIYAFQIEEDVREDINKEINANFKTQDNLTNLGNDLLDEKIEAILVSSSQYAMISEEIEDFEDDTRIIYKSNHEIEKTAEVSVGDSKYTIGNGIFNVYISGIDTSGSISNVSRSDANIIATVNTKTHEVLLTSIPRDYYVTLHSKGAKDKLTHSGIYGINETVTTVEDLLDIDINYYVRVNFTTVIKLVDVLGGIDVYSANSFSRGGYTFSQGYNHLNGDAALVFSRERYSFASGDNQRVKNQQAVIEAIAKKVLNSETLLKKSTDILDSLQGSFQTNIEQDEMSSLVRSQLSNMSSWTFKNNALEGTGSYGPTYSMGSTQLYIMLPNQTSVANAKAKINEAMGE